MLSDTQYQGPAMIVGWNGRVDGDNGDTFEHEVLASTLNRGQYIVINADGIDYVSSAGIRAFLMVAQELSDNGQSMAICSLRPEVKKIFNTIGFGEILPMHDSIADAVAAVAA